MSPVGLIVNGIIVIVIGVVLGKYVQPMFSGEWPTILSYGAYIWGGGSVLLGLSRGGTSMDDNLAYLSKKGMEGAERRPPTIESLSNLFLKGDYTDTIDATRQYLQEHPKDQSAWVLAGRAYTELADFSNAENCFKEALGHDSDNVDALKNLGILYRLLGDYDRAMVQYERACDLEPNDASIYSSMCVAETYRKRFGKAIKNGTKALELEGHDATIAMNLALAYHFAGEAENRDRLTAMAEALGYPNMERVRNIYSGKETLW